MTTSAGEKLINYPNSHNQVLVNVILFARKWIHEYFWVCVSGWGWGAFSCEKDNVLIFSPHLSQKKENIKNGTIL